jgi:hypothetical protein
MSSRAGQIFALLVMLGGCAAQLTDNQRSLVGQPIEAAIAKYGVPSDEKTVAGRKIYTWSSSQLSRGTEEKCELRAVVTGNVISSFETSGNGLYCLQYEARLRR